MSVIVLGFCFNYVSQLRKCNSLKSQVIFCEHLVCPSEFLFYKLGLAVFKPPDLLARLDVALEVKQHIHVPTCNNKITNITPKFNWLTL
jgi:hypothetical protein